MVTGTMNVPSVNANAVSNVKPSVKINQSAAASFDSFMNQTGVKQNASGSAADESKIDVGDKPAKEDLDKAMSTISKVKDAVNKAGKADGSISEEVASELETQIKDAVKEALGISDEDLENALSLLGLTVFDLLNSQNLAAVIIETGFAPDSISFLADAQISEVFADLNKELGNIVSETANELGLSDVQLKDAIAELETDASKDEVTVNTSRADNDDLRANKRNNNNVVDNSVRTQTLEQNITVKADGAQGGGKNSHDNSNAGANEHSLASQFIDNMSRAIENVSSVNESFAGYGVDAESILRQVVDAVKVNVTADTSSMEMALHPESLGKILLNVAARDGVITATITASDETVKAALESQLITLKETMNEQGLKVEAVEVTVASHQFEDGRNFENTNSNADTNEEQQKNNSGLRQISLESDVEELDDDEIVIQEMMRANGNNVDYTA